MRKISFMISLLSMSVAGVLTSCSEDYPGPDPVDVTANYSNKFSTPNPNLSITYSGIAMEGKAVDFSTVKGETATLTLYDILPGEEALKITSIPLTNDDNRYSFSGTATGQATGATFNYSGSVEKGKLNIDLTNIKMANSSQWAQSYVFNPMTYGKGKDIGYNEEKDEYEWKEGDNVIIQAPFYTDMDVELNGEEGGNNIFLYANITGPIRGLGSYLLAQLLNNITLEPDGNIIAEYTTDDMMLGELKFSEIDMDNEEVMQAVIGFVVSKLFGGGFSQDDIDLVTTDIERKYTASPRGLAYWYMKNGIFYVKLDLPAIIVQVMQSQGKPIDKNVISTLTEAILSSNPIQLQQLLAKVNRELNNSIISILVNMSNSDFQSLFTCIKGGIPMHIEKPNEDTYIYVEKEVLTPLVNLLPNLMPSIESMPMGSMLTELYLKPFMKGWPNFIKLNIGLGLQTKSNAQ